MMQTVLLNGKSSMALIVRVARRNIGITAPTLQKAKDPIQQLFVSKVREYQQKSGGKLLDPSPEIQKELKFEHEKCEKLYGGGPGVNLEEFPEFKFVEPAVDPINQQI